MDYEVQWSSQAFRELEDLERDVQERILAAVDGLGRNPRPSGVKKLQAQDNRYRVRVGDFRVFYEIYDRVLIVVVVKVADRKDAYR